MLEKNKSENGLITVSQKESPSRRELAYTEDFKEFVKDLKKQGRKEVFKDFLELISSDGGNWIQGMDGERGEVKITKTSKPEDDQYCYKVEVAGHIFFAKVPSKKYSHGDTGYKQLLSSSKAKELLKGLEGVEVANFQLGYSDKNQQVFIASWNEAFQKSRLSDYQEKNDNLENNLSIAHRVSEIKKRLEEFYDIKKLNNMVYDPEKDVIYLFDLAEI